MENTITLKRKSFKDAGLFACGDVEFWATPRVTRAFEKTGKVTKALRDACEKARIAIDKNAYIEVAAYSEACAKLLKHTEKAIAFHFLRWGPGPDPDTWTPRSLIHTRRVGEGAIFVAVPLWFAKKNNLKPLRKDDPKTFKKNAKHAEPFILKAIERQSFTLV